LTANVSTVHGDTERSRLGDYYADEGVDKHLQLRTRISAGPHDVGATFLRKNGAFVETERQPYDAHFNMNRHPRLTPAVYTLSITGPFDAGAVGETPSRQRIFVCRPAARAEEAACARRIVSATARRAYRRPVTDRDIAVLGLFDQARGGRVTPASGGAPGDVDLPRVPFRIGDPSGTAGASYRITDLELASRCRRGAAFPTIGCWTRPSAGAFANRPCSTPRCVVCSPISRLMRSPSTSLAVSP
jgi:hypothetical protein